MNNGPTCGAQTHMELLSGRPPDRQYKHTCTDGETDRQTVRQTKRERGLQLAFKELLPTVRFVVVDAD